MLLGDAKRKTGRGENLGKQCEFRVVVLTLAPGRQDAELSIIQGVDEDLGVQAGEC